MGHRGPRRPLREHLGSPKGHFGDCRFSSRKTYIGPQGPLKVTSFFSMCRFGGAKNAQVALSGAPGRAYQSLWGPLWPLLGPRRSEKLIFRHAWWNLEGNRCAQNPRSAPGPPRRTPKGRFWSDFGRLGVDFGATLGVHGPILDRFCTDWVLHVGRCCVAFRICTNIQTYMHTNVQTDTQ